MNNKLTAIVTLLFATHLAVAQMDMIIPIGHSRRVLDMKVSSDHQWLASIDGSSQITIWNYESGMETYHFTASAPITNIAFGSNYLFSADKNGTILQYTLDGKVQQSISTEFSVLGLFAESADSVLAVGEHELKWFFKGKAINSSKSKVESITAVYKVGPNIVIGGNDGSLEVFSSDLKSTNQLSLSDAAITSISEGNEGWLVATQKGELIQVNSGEYSSKSINAFSLRTLDIAYIPFKNLILTCGRDSKQNLKAFDLSMNEKALPFEWNEPVGTEAFNLGLRVVVTTSDTTLLLADYQNIIKEYDFKNNAWVKTFKGHASPIYDLSVDRSGTKLAIAAGQSSIQVLDLTGTDTDIILPGSRLGSRAVSFHPVNPVIASYGLDEQIRVTNLINQKELFTLKAKGDYSTTPITFDITGRYVIRKSSEEDFDLYNFSTSQPQNLKVKNGKDYVFTPDGRQLVFLTNKGLTVYDPISFQKVKDVSLENAQGITIGSNGTLAVLLKDDLTAEMYQTNQLTKNGQITLAKPADKLYWSPSGKELIGVRNSIKRGESGADYSIYIFDASNGKLLKTLPGHSGFTYDIEFVNGKMLTASIDGTVKIWQISGSATDPKGTLIPMDSDQYVVTTPKGLFDATPAAMEQIHYVKKGKIINLEQIKDNYYEPMLLSKLLELNSEPIRSSNDLANESLYPELSLKHPLKNEGKLGINLSNNGGGIGRVIILINGKEVSSDVRSASGTPDASSLEIDYDITNHPFLYNDRVNKITIKAYNTDGTLSSDAKSLYVFGEEKTLEAPSIYAVIAGTSDYEGDALDLKYAAKDATDLANALKLSATKYLGVEKTNIKLLTTDQDKSNWPTKANIEKAFREFQSQAKANDILFVYLSGHGVNHSGDMSDFYYLTSSASNGDMNNSVAREKDAISSAEFTEYIKAVPALKQILIIDACHSGRLASSLASSRSAMSSTQIRALERMKDRTGLFVLAGSAADAVSYETTLYGQGLLTYSLLFGMKGAALRDDEFIDVLDLFQFAANKVPELAAEIGGIQKPEIRVPEDGKSFDIGRLEPADRDAISLAAPKPVYVHTRFQDESAIFDRLNLNELLDQKLIELSKVDDAPIAFVDDKNFSGATIINGRYSEDNGLLKAQVTFVSNNAVSKQVTVEAVNAELLAEAILKELDY